MIWKYCKFSRYNYYAISSFFAWPQFFNLDNPVTDPVETYTTSNPIQINKILNIRQSWTLKSGSFTPLLPCNIAHLAEVDKERSLVDKERSLFFLRRRRLRTLFCGRGEVEEEIDFFKFYLQYSNSLLESFVDLHQICALLTQHYDFFYVQMSVFASLMCYSVCKV